MVGPLPAWCLSLLRTRRVRLGGFDGPVFPDGRGGYRDRNNVSAAFRPVRAGTAFEWVRPHTFRKTVATVLDSSVASARLIADQLGHARISMTQDVYMGRRAVGSEAAAALEGHNPDSARPHDGCMSPRMSAQEPLTARTEATFGPVPWGLSRRGDFNP
jgi:integrase